MGNNNANLPTNTRKKPGYSLGDDDFLRESDMKTSLCQRIFYGDIKEATQDFHDGVELYTNVSHEELKRIETEGELKRYIYRLWTINPQ